MFVIACRLNIPEIECPRIRIFLPQRRKARQVRREKMNYLEEFFYRYFPTFAAFASLREIFRVSVTAVRRQANLFSPAQSGKKRVLLSMKVFPACANFLRAEDPSDSDMPRAKSRQGRQVRKSISFLCALCVLCARYSKFRLRRSRDGLFVVNQSN